MTTHSRRPAGDRVPLFGPSETADQRFEREFTFEPRPAPEVVRLSPLLDHPCCDPARDLTVMSCQLCPASATYWRTR